MPKKSQTKSNLKPTKNNSVNQSPEQKNSIWDIFKFGESYTSLVLGIIVVIIATITLLSFVKGKNDLAKNTKNNQQLVAMKINATATPGISKEVSIAPTITSILTATPTLTLTPTPTVADEPTPTTSEISWADDTETSIAPTTNPVTPTKEIIPTKRINPTRIITPTLKITPTAKPTPTSATKKIVKPTLAKPSLTPTTKAKPTKVIAKKINPTVKKEEPTNGKYYVTVAGDSLWTIAEKKYNNGYNWVAIQKANNLSNPDVLYSGTKLLLPDIKPAVATASTSNNKVTQKTDTITQTDKITGNSYIVVKNDSLWDIAIRAYGDGYAWTKIAKANNLSNPDVIHSGNKLIIPRG